MTVYELWETASANRIAAYPTRAAALALVRRQLRAYGEWYVATWLLAVEDDDGNTTTIAAGDDLAALVRDAGAAG